MFLFKVAEPNEALIISGLRAHHGTTGDAAGLGFKIVVGKGAFYVPGFQKVRHLSLDIHETELDLECVTGQGIRINVKAVVIYKIADDYASIANAARRFLDQEDQMDVKVHRVFAGHLRSIVGTMTVEDMIRNRDALTRATRESSATEMQRLGLTIDSLQIQEIEESSGYIENLGAPEASRVAKEARIARANSDREATQREQEAEALKVAAESESDIKQAESRANAQQAQAARSKLGRSPRRRPSNRSSSRRRRSPSSRPSAPRSNSRPRSGSPPMPRPTRPGRSPRANGTPGSRRLRRMHGRSS
jgi:flotillin